MPRQVADADPTNRAFPVSCHRPSLFLRARQDGARLCRPTRLYSRARETMQACSAKLTSDQLSTLPIAEIAHHYWLHHSGRLAECIGMLHKSAIGHNGCGSFCLGKPTGRYSASGYTKRQSTTVLVADRQHRSGGHSASQPKKRAKRNRTAPLRQAGEIVFS